MSDPVTYEYLFCFVDKRACLAEVKVRDLPEGTPPARVYHWLYFDRQTQELTRLLFRSMREEDGRGYRQFAQGKLNFDAGEACLDLQDPQVEIELPAGLAPVDFDNQVRVYLQGLE